MVKETIEIVPEAKLILKANNNIWRKFKKIKPENYTLHDLVIEAIEEKIAKWERDNHIRLDRFFDNNGNSKKSKNGDKND